MKKCYVFGHTFKELPHHRYYYKYECTECERKTDNPEVERFEYTFWDSNTWETAKFILTSLLTIAVAAYLAVSLGNFINSISCMKYQELGIDTIYSFWTGCMAKHPVYGWVPVEEYFKILNVIIK